MSRFLWTWFLATVLLVALDALWLPMVWKSVYKPVDDRIQRKMTFRVWSAAFTWVLLGLIIALHKGGNGDNAGNAGNGDKGGNKKIYTRGNAFLVGALSGFIVYGVYNFTNYATLTHYTLKLSILDTMWGTLALGIVSALLLP